MSTLPADLSTALDTELARFPAQRMADAVQGLIHRYRAGVDPTEQVLDADLTVAAYAAYRMPATFAAVSAALRQVAMVAPDFAPRSLIDLGGGTGTAVWAAARTWPSLAEVTVLEQSTPAIALGKRLAARSEVAAVRGAIWQRAVISGAVTGQADVITLSYVLNELAAQARAEVVTSLAERAGVVVIVEPGTPVGYERIVAARDDLIRAGMRVVAPCPHSGTCPIPRGKDWCHFAERLNRSALHRKLKTGALGHEDEKFAYVAATRADWGAANNRVLRHPRSRKGLVSLRLCTGDGALTDTVVTKRDPEAYRAARDAGWGDPWP
ncbi:small ribosomal subunit Rsm22 family protein [Actinokineospora iranica]|uniref:Ribosomal protein RSM22 (Predicted rRNA methylase) n=1 Tax=Actinokineospora iranica TaxID=1271860 RepID=A0A1G6RX29_9PSEU|nr:small ribosomal subunit Rsm22 family protein [Actinokineospora iranica]SDD09222.1 Ribosomal protein RSM22 (predicted rRNA methylase) [Actinokineospora iranica]